MLTDEFDRCFNRLLDAARRYHDAPRDPARVIALADARLKLEVARKAVADERAQLPTAALSRSIRRPIADEAEQARRRVYALGLTTN